MIICRRCKTHNEDDSTTCSSCATDLGGSDGIRVPGGTGSARPSPASSPQPADQLPDLPPRTEDEPGGPPPAPAGSPSLEAPPPESSEPVRWSTTQDRPRLVVRDDAESGEVVRPTAKTYDHVPAGVRPDDDGVLDDDGLTEVVESDDPLVVGGRPVADIGTAFAGVTLDERRAPTIDEIACNECGEPNDEARRFCQLCGATLPAFTDPPDDVDDLSDEEPSRWRRMLGTVKDDDGHDGRTHGQRMRDSGQRKLQYRARRTLRSRLATLGIGAGLLGGGLMALGPWRDQIQDLFSGDPEPEIPSAVFLEGGNSEDDGAADGNDTTALIFPWDLEGDQTPVTIVVELDEAVTLEQVVLTPLPNTTADAALFLRPSAITIDGGGTAIDAQIGDGGTPSRVDVDLGSEVDRLEITINDVHEVVWDTEPAAAIAEIGVVPA